jgi:hypothetical protein
MVHVPVPLVIVTVVPLIEQAPLVVMVGVMPALDVVSTVNVDWYGALDGAPVKLTVGAILAARVVFVTFAAR